MSAESQKACFGCKSSFHDQEPIHQFVHEDITYSIHATPKCAILAVNQLIYQTDPVHPVQVQRDNLLEKIFKHIL